eukprot:5881724-Heterocapsa_arctica.AAC.1
MADEGEVGPLRPVRRAERHPALRPGPGGGRGGQAGHGARCGLPEVVLQVECTEWSAGRRVEALKSLFLGRP